MAELPVGFDAFTAKWVPEPPPWKPSGDSEAWRDADTEEGRRKAYQEQMHRIGPELPAALAARLRRDAGSGAPMLEILEGLLAEPAVGSGKAAALAVQQLFGVPASRASFLASWRPGNRSDEANKVLERVALCIADARQAGLWEAPDTVG